MDHKLFVYGELKPQYYPPQTDSEPKKDIIEADLYDLGKDAAAIRIGLTDNIAHGFVFDVDKEVLKKLDKLEAPEYSRVRTVTKGKVLVWVYQFNGKLPINAKKVTNWHEHKKQGE